MLDGYRVGQRFRVVRLQLGLRQTDVARLAGVSQGMVSLLERGRLESLSLATIRAIAGALGVTVRIDVRWRGGDLDRLTDRDHAASTEFVASAMHPSWVIRPEYTFNHYGDRGSVDLLAWHPGERVLLIIEIKTQLTDLQATLASHARKVRVVPTVVERSEGWEVARVGRLLVVTGTTANRSVVAAHPTIFDTSFPQRGHEIRRWLRNPVGPMAGLWFVPPMTVSRGRQLRTAQRVRVTGSGRS